MLDKRSGTKLATCTFALQDVFNEVARRSRFKFKVIEGYRTIERQEELFELGRSKVRRGTHNEQPSRGVDVVVLQADGSIDWADRELFTYFAGYVLGVAESMGASLRWLGDEDGDGDLKDNKFDDLVHFEELT